MPGSNGFGKRRLSQTRWESGTAARSWYGYDVRGNVRGLLEQNRFVTDHYDYDAYGNLVRKLGTTFNTYFYAGEQLDETTATPIAAMARPTRRPLWSP